MNPSDRLAEHFRIDTAHQKALKKLRIETVSDLLHHLPSRYEDISDIQSVSGLTTGSEAVVYGQLGGLKARKAWKSKRPIAEGWLEDGTSRIKVMWFNQPYLAKMYKDGQYVKASGKVTGVGDKMYIANPELEPLESLPIDRHDSIFKNTENIDDTIYPVYKETKGVTSRWFYHTVMKCFEAGVLEKVTDPIPTKILERYKLYELKTALRYIHSPKKLDHATGARKRFAFEEVFYIQVQKAMERATVSAATSYNIDATGDNVEEFISRFPFPLTRAQQRAIDEILKDFSGQHAMSRLLEGDVGSGKTAVAATTAYAVVTSRPPEGRGTKSGIDYGNLQVAYMAPTEILAKQHFESFIEYFEHLPIQIGLITGSGCYKFPSKSDPTKPTKISKAQLMKWVKNGEVPILIGTHALIYKSVEFKHLAYVIIDEQHRFGTNQRKALTKKGAPMPHLLSMTATPIPRTLSLTIYGDLDLTLLDEMPKGRKQVITKIIGPNQQEPMYEHVKGELKAGRQAYVICPRIDEPDPEKENALNLKSVISEAERLRTHVFKNAQIDVLHGKMTPSEKDKVMKRFLDHESDVLVATSVVEVGVNVPNATNIIIEGAERFGLSQLHQLRGRVIRGTYQPYCFAVTESKSEKTRDRLKALSTAKNGFELSEYDLQFRGAGELYGSKQSGLSDLGMEALKNLKLVEAARAEARTLVETDPELKKHNKIAERVTTLGLNLHLE
ncbi:ATP-dependent DNA helicase RecG [Candidatus Nomurabacteria bacterium]|nr:ATP-dependent DNA helicase RecG [Candidatus Nomurabacteria bacterium]MCB9819362.1 ATP-dependent DNA helicase RecG [Candidatus Nomurabacteria bacterium]